MKFEKSTIKLCKNPILLRLMILSSKKLYYQRAFRQSQANSFQNPERSLLIVTMKWKSTIHPRCRHYKKKDHSRGLKLNVESTFLLIILCHAITEVSNHLKRNLLKLSKIRQELTSNKSMKILPFWGIISLNFKKKKTR